VDPPVAGGVVDTGFPDAEIVIVPVSSLAFASFAESSFKLTLSEPLSVAVKFISTCRVSPEGSVPSVQVAVPAPVVQVPPFTVTDVTVTVVGKVAVTLTEFDASSPSARTRNDATKGVPVCAGIVGMPISSPTSGGLYAVKQRALLMYGCICEMLHAEN
jgi:hypothetical protein